MKKCTSFEEQKGRRYIRGNFYFGIIVFSCLLPTNLCLRFLSVCFAREIKSFYQSSLGNEVDFRDIMSVSQISSCHWKTLILFCLRKKRPEDTFLTLIVNYCKMVQKNKLCHPKQPINWLFSDIWCYLFIAYFDSKIGIFQQTFVRVYYTWSINISLFQNDKKVIRR